MADDPDKRRVTLPSESTEPPGWSDGWLRRMFGLRPGEGMPQSAAPPPPHIFGTSDGTGWVDPGYDDRTSPDPPRIDPPQQRSAPSDSFSAGDFAVLISCALFAEPFCHAAADQFLHGNYDKAALGFLIGLPPGLAGGSFHWWKKRLSERARRLVLPSSLTLGIAGAILAFAYIAGPEMYRRATEPRTSAHVAQPLCWDGTPQPCSFVSPLPPIAEPLPGGALSWFEALSIESAFLSVPRPCTLKLTATRGNFNARNILRAIVIRNSGCDILGDQRDMSPQPVDVDAAPEPKVSGLIIRWNPSYASGESVFRILSGFLRASPGHAMPPNSPDNLIWIQVGDGYPWEK